MVLSLSTQEQQELNQRIKTMKSRVKHIRQTLRQWAGMELWERKEYNQVRKSWQAQYKELKKINRFFKQ